MMRTILSSKTGEKLGVFDETQMANFLDLADKFGPLANNFEGQNYRRSRAVSHFDSEPLAKIKADRDLDKLSSLKSAYMNFIRSLPREDSESLEEVLRLFDGRVRAKRNLIEIVMFTSWDSLIHAHNSLNRLVLFRISCLFNPGFDRIYKLGEDAINWTIDAFDLLKKVQRERRVEHRSNNYRRPIGLDDPVVETAIQKWVVVSKKSNGAEARKEKPKIKKTKISEGTDTDLISTVSRIFPGISEEEAVKVIALASYYSAQPKLPTSPPQKYVDRDNPRPKGEDAIDFIKRVYSGFPPKTLSQQDFSQLDPSLFKAIQNMRSNEDTANKVQKYLLDRSERIKRLVTAVEEALQGELRTSKAEFSRELSALSIALKRH